MAEFAVFSGRAKTTPIQTMAASIIRAVTPPLTEPPIETLRTTWWHHTVHQWNSTLDFHKAHYITRNVKNYLTSSNLRGISEISGWWIMWWRQGKSKGRQRRRNEELKGLQLVYWGILGIYLYIFSFSRHFCDFFDHTYDKGANKMDKKILVLLY